MNKLLSLVVLGALLLAACGSGSGGSGEVAATVNGTDVTVGDVEALIDSEEATLPVEAFTEYLAAQIQWHIFFDAAEADYGVNVTDDEVEAEADRLFETLATEGETREDFLSTRGITELFLTNIAKQSAIDMKIRESLREEAPEPTAEDLDEARVGLTNACVSHILVETEDEATEVMSRLEQGEDFGALATELSTDTGSAANNGVLPCGSPQGYVAPFRDAVLAATVGEVVSQPVQSEFGYHVILVTERTDPTEEELVEGVKDNLILVDLQTWFGGVMEGAEVTVAEDYGTWQANPPSIIPPNAGTTGTTTGG